MKTTYYTVLQADTKEMLFLNQSKPHFWQVRQHNGGLPPKTPKCLDSDFTCLLNFHSNSFSKWYKILFTTRPLLKLTQEIVLYSVTYTERDIICNPASIKGSLQSEVQPFNNNAQCSLSQHFLQLPCLSILNIFLFILFPFFLLSKQTILPPDRLIHQGSRKYFPNEVKK